MTSCVCACTLLGAATWAHQTFILFNHEIKWDSCVYASAHNNNKKIKAQLLSSTLNKHTQ